MTRLFDLSARLRDLRQLMHWMLLAVPAGIAAGSAAALFLWSLDAVTRLHWQNPWLLWLLPAGGLAVGLLYHYAGRGSERGNNLLIDEIHEPGSGVPVRMAPLVLIGTLVTHLFGGSAGREGTALQMGGGLAEGLSRCFRLAPQARRLILMCGIAAGFGAVFGTPLTGAIFAMEVLVIGRLQYGAVLPVLLAAVIGDSVCTAWGIHHTHYPQVGPVASVASVAGMTLLGRVALAGAAFGLISVIFTSLTHSVQRGAARLIRYAPLRPVAGGLLVILMVWLCGTRDFLGLGVEAPPGGSVSIVSSFQSDAGPLSWLGKTLFTAVTLGTGFKGGEVTPLFFIGATAGSALGGFFGDPVALFAALGFIAVFAGAANTPLACTIMGIELFGAHAAVPFAIACFVAWFCSGHAGIYSAQRRTGSKRSGDPSP